MLRRFRTQQVRLEASPRRNWKPNHLSCEITVKGHPPVFGRPFIPISFSEWERYGALMALAQASLGAIVISENKKKPRFL
jgi:hypothetical protein